MWLSELIEGEEEMRLPTGAQSVEITGLTADSRQVAPGFLFAALPGSQEDGRKFIPQALEKGASAILAPEGTQLDSLCEKTPFLLDANPRQRLAKMAALFYRQQPSHCAAVTGTSGKTSTVTFARQLWQALGRQAASLGTLGIEPAYEGAPKALTTPDPVALMESLAKLKGQGFDHVALEASSHGLDQYRLDGLKVTSAAFTNLSRDHLDYHPTMEAYLAAKARLFSDLLQPGGSAVLNADIPEYDHLKALSTAAGHDVISYGKAGQALTLISLEPKAGRIDLELDIRGRFFSASLPLAGPFQAWNILAALGLLIAEGEAPQDLLEVLPQVKGVPGRMEPVGQSAKGGQVYVDYAHKPGALETVLKALRAHTQGRIIAVYGCGGDRDAGKRPMMGAIARELAEVRIVTDDNPRNEDPAKIRKEVLAADPDALEIGDRREAILAAIRMAEAGDTLVIAGKGHESGQLVAGHSTPFDDRDVARSLLAQEGGEPQ